MPCEPGPARALCGMAVSAGPPFLPSGCSVCGRTLHPSLLTGGLSGAQSDRPAAARQGLGCCRYFIAEGEVRIFDPEARANMDIQIGTGG